MVKRAVKTAEVGRSKAHMVAATIEQDILTGRLPFGQQLESENELVERFAVSRNTVRKGLDLLTNGGLITRKGGIGSFVTFNGQAIDGTLGWTTAIEKAGGGAQTRLLQIALVEDETLAQELKLTRTTFVAIDRMRVIGADAQCISLERSRLPFNDDLAALPLEGLAGGSLNRTLIEHGMVPHHGEQWAEVVSLDAADARLLKRRAGTSFLRSRRLTRDRDERIIEYVVSLLDPAFFALHLEF
ncbi:GntR family transcriptional regulator [Caballeronia mineralivorans]|jgi:GntR family transcriptional regulator|uniref:GntR family transcriptional regulator n=1 Tax=Caballeronia mineralivorans TaxID=2010198 RepID=UPI0023F2D86A|nr:GntR family transcriptional regulator [Caballeronia mineralivorans]MDB5785926.1 GntR family transcriptional regulator [Caballeronia mineralivorans]MEA3096672.1 GntR family transcriptional regulator [Caballeronia mineralivorans]